MILSLIAIQAEQVDSNLFFSPTTSTKHHMRVHHKRILFFFLVHIHVHAPHHLYVVLYPAHLVSHAIHVSVI